MVLGRKAMTISFNVANWSTMPKWDEARDCVRLELHASKYVQSYAS